MIIFEILFYLEFFQRTNINLAVTDRSYDYCINLTALLIHFKLLVSCTLHLYIDIFFIYCILLIY